MIHRLGMFLLPFSLAQVRIFIVREARSRVHSQDFHRQEGSEQKYAAPLAGTFHFSSSFTAAIVDSGLVPIKDRRVQACHRKRLLKRVQGVRVFES